jgi:cbb3-type cytochrome oxidase subunit 3
VEGDAWVWIVAAIILLFAAYMAYRFGPRRPR